MPALRLALRMLLTERGITREEAARLAAEQIERSDRRRLHQSERALREALQQQLRRARFDLVFSVAAEAENDGLALVHPVFEAMQRDAAASSWAERRAEEEALHALFRASQGRLSGDMLMEDVALVLEDIVLEIHARGPHPAVLHVPTIGEPLPPRALDALRSGVADDLAIALHGRIDPDTPLVHVLDALDVVLVGLTEKPGINRQQPETLTA